MFEAILAACDPAALLFGSVAERYRRGLLGARDHQRREHFKRRCTVARILVHGGDATFLGYSSTST